MIHMCCAVIPIISPQRATMVRMNENTLYFPTSFSSFFFFFFSLKNGEYYRYGFFSFTVQDNSFARTYLTNALHTKNVFVKWNCFSIFMIALLNSDLWTSCFYNLGLCIEIYSLATTGRRIIMTTQFIICLFQIYGFALWLLQTKLFLLHRPSGDI